MRARFTEDQELLRRSARAFLEAECPVSQVRSWTEPAGQPAAIPATIWKKLSELGWTGIGIPESCGGAGLGMVELCIVLEETGRTLLPGPFLSATVFGGQGVALAGSDVQRKALLPRIASGSLRIALALAEAGGSFDPADVTLGVARSHGALRLRGAKRFVQDAASADQLLVVGRGPEGAIELVLVPTDVPGVTVRAIPLVDGTRHWGEVRFDDVEVEESAVLTAAEGGAASLERLLDRARVALAAEMCGGARRALELSVEYAKTREQFGAPIGRFQAIQHRCADMLVRVESAFSATYYAAWSAEEGEPDAHVAACMAKATASEAFRDVAASAIQIHGGLGFTWEQDPQLYYKRAKASELMLGDAAFHRERIARATLDTDSGSG